MTTEKESAFRILSHREGSVQPMFDAATIGPLSPSSSLLVERRDLDPTSWQSHLLQDQLLHFFMTNRGQMKDYLDLWPSPANSFTP
ncbi:MAG TPA: hypothetical protein VK638_07010 [Edaphobacter sp.]|nr:hypothetical protein [Edaphobacter sp.]